MTGTYEHRGGTAAHDPAFDRDDGVSELEDRVGQALEAAQELHAKLSAAEEELAGLLAEALGALVKPGDVLQQYRGFGRLSVMRGNARGANAFEVVTAPRMLDLNLTHPNLSRFQVEAYPLNDDGKRLSGRAGNSRFGAPRDTVSLHVHVADGRGPDDRRSGNDLVMEVIGRAAAAMAGSAA